MVQPIILARQKPIRHRLNALAIAGSNQTRGIEQANPSARPVALALHKWLKPPLEIVCPSVCVLAGPPKGRPPVNRANPPLGILKKRQPLKIRQSGAR